MNIFIETLKTAINSRINTFYLLVASFFTREHLAPCSITLHIPIENSPNACPFVESRTLEDANIIGAIVHAADFAGQCSKKGKLPSREIVAGLSITMTNHRDKRVYDNLPLNHWAFDKTTTPGAYAQLSLPNGYNVDQTNIDVCLPDNVVIPENTVVPITFFYFPSANDC